MKKKYSRLITFNSLIVLGIGVIATPALQLNHSIQQVQAETVEIEGDLSDYIPRNVAVTQAQLDALTVNNSIGSFYDRRTKKWFKNALAYQQVKANPLLNLVLDMNDVPDSFKQSKFKIEFFSHNDTPDKVLQYMKNQEINGGTVPILIAIGNKQRYTMLNVVDELHVGKYHFEVMTQNVDKGDEVLPFEKEEVLKSAIKSPDFFIPIFSEKIEDTRISSFYGMANDEVADFRTLTDYQANDETIFTKDGKFNEAGTLLQLIPFPYSRIHDVRFDFKYFLNEERTGITLEAPKPSKTAVAFIPKEFIVKSDEVMVPVFGGDVGLTNGGTVNQTLELASKPLDLLAGVVVRAGNTEIIPEITVKDEDGEVVELVDYQLSLERTGKYTVTYTAGETISATRIIEVVDNTPVFNLANGIEQNPVLNQNSGEYDLLNGVSAVSNGQQLEMVLAVKNQQDQSVDVQQGMLSTSEAGKFSVTYTAKSASGMRSIFERTITIKAVPVVEPKPPVEVTPPAEVIPAPPIEVTPPTVVAPPVPVIPPTIDMSYTIQVLDKVGQINNKVGVSVYTKPGLEKTAQLLPVGTNWKIFGKATMNKDGEAWYQVGQNQWIKAEQVELNRNVQINYVPGYGINLWAYHGDHVTFTGQRLSHNTTWKVFATMTTMDGEVWYNLGGNQWILAEYAVIL